MGKSTSLELNAEQIKAINFGKGPLLIIAGAGTGKTTVITERIKNLILEKKAKPEEILALTFTEKAAQEMEARVDVALPYGYINLWIYTFHSFCDRVLRDEALSIGLNPRYKLLTEAEAVQLLRKNLFLFDLDYFRPLGNPNKFIEGMLQHFSRLQDEDISPSSYLKWVAGLKANTAEEKEERQKYRELSKAYQTYEEIKIKEGKFDFGDLITKTLKLFRERKNILKKYQKQFKYVLIDEFQDTNYAQYELIKLLSNPNITVVGDDSQSIYKFRGAAVSNILSFKKDYPKAKTISLIKNYRSVQTILDAAYRLIKFNDPDTLEAQLGISKKLVSQVKSKNEGIKFIHVDRVENEADEIAKEIEKLVESKNYDYKDVGILLRANNHAEPIARALSRHAIPYQFLGPGRLFKQPEVADLIAFLKVLANFEDSVAFYRLLSIDDFEISPRELAAIGNYARKNNLSLFEAAEKIGSEKVKKIVDAVDKGLKRGRRESPGQILYDFLVETELLPKMLSPTTGEAEKKAKNVAKFFDKLKTYETDHEEATVATVVDWLDLSMELGESPLVGDTDWTQVNAVNLLTVHGAKGLEFPVVFLVNLVSQRFPSTERREQIPIPEKLIKEVLPQGNFHLEEERRLFYVGMTRAKERLYFTAADYYGEGKRGKKLSPFIFEALGKLQDKLGRIGEENRLSFIGYEKRGENISEITARENIKIDYLSYSQIDTFLTCPLHFKLKYIYKVPTPVSPSQSFGTALHAVLKDFYLKVKEGEKPTEKLIFRLLKDNWIKEGYLNKIQEEKFLDKAKDYLRGFFREEFDPRVKTVALELPFSVPLIKKGGGDELLKIGGKIDRVDLLSDGSIEIIDYKTGATIPTQDEANQNLQLSFYAIAAAKIKEAPLGKNPTKIKLSLYYLDSQEKITTSRSEEQLARAVEEIFKIRKEIERSDFKCSGHMFCQGKCEYSLFCKLDL